jgi:hypothetical protein
LSAPEAFDEAVFKTTLFPERQTDHHLCYKGIFVLICSNKIRPFKNKMMSFVGAVEGILPAKRLDVFGSTSLLMSSKPYYVLPILLLGPS